MERGRHLTRRLGSGRPSHEQSVYPDGYVPAGATPMEDFIAKFVGARYVIDAGTNHERSMFLPADEILRAGYVTPSTYGDLAGLPQAVWAPALRPLPVGEHEVDVYVVMSADHWDGVGVDLAVNFLPAGESRFGPPPFHFNVSPHRPAHGDRT